MSEEFVRALCQASTSCYYNKKLQEDLWGMKKARRESLAQCSKGFRALVCMENTLTQQDEHSLMSEGNLQARSTLRLKEQVDASRQVYTTVAALASFFERIEQREEHLGHNNSDAQEKSPDNHDKLRNQGRRSGFNNWNGGNGHNRQQNRGGTRDGGYASGQNYHNSNNSADNKYCMFHRTNTHNTQDYRALHNEN
ncbi:LOW QUALITY PROTEIN: hypothetical protein PHMEG_00013418 [Phytophthora megakarya]|uniref:Uncharacterized protein n=1 Tax=Phytophthora megakarya TaxID=4795 RepID=A0A225W8W8_9STRA|nr:LOW QUALITY PROTEIN: hypothetical protein PHMEG_00013418 [Phytophthora megakarya]